ncbi:uncharacterized protein LOC100178067 [Ciona intestinalis]
MDSVKFKFVQEVTQYGDKLLKRLDEFRRKNLYYDVRIKTIDDKFVAHKVVLAACGGVFRRNFVDPNTMMIIGDVTEVTFDCCSIGLSPILNFAYSGTLEISAENLIPVFVASGSTEMKEVQDICASLTMERLGWILAFDGKQSLCDVTIEESFAKLEKILRINLKSFGESPVSVEGEFPCLPHVEGAWPELGGVYKLLVDCVRRAKVVDNGNKVNDKPGEVVTVDTTATKKESANEIKEDSATNETKQEPEKTEVKEPKVPTTQDTTNTENSKPTSKITKDETIKDSTKEPTKELEESTPAKEDSKPPTKPPNINGNQPDGRPKLKPRTISIVDPEEPKTQQSPKVTKRKPTAPKPPTEASPVSNRTKRGSQHKPTQTLPSPPTRPPKPSPKVPPPRPKPPSIKKNKPKPTIYDEKLNPFSLDETDSNENEENDKKTNSTENNPFE